jgi:hypothetical protein
MIRKLGEVMKITLLVHSSDGDFYSVNCKNNEGIISIKCDCVAGSYTKLCKHKLSMILGKHDSLYDPKQIEDLNTVQEWISKSGYPELLKKLEVAEKELLDKQREVRKLKESLELAMRKGI